MKDLQKIIEQRDLLSQKIEDEIEANRDQGFGYEELGGIRYYVQTKNGTLPQSYFKKRSEMGLSNTGRPPRILANYGWFRFKILPC